MSLPSNIEELLELIAQDIIDNNSGLIEESTLRNVLNQLVKILDTKISLISPNLTAEQLEIWKRLADFKASDSIGVITTSTVFPDAKCWGFAAPGTYPNANNLVISANNIGVITFDGNTTYSKIQLPIPQSTQYIPPFIGSVFPIVGKVQRIYSGNIWEIAEGISSSNSDIPGISDKWNKVTNSFDENEFNAQAQQFVTYNLETADLSAINFANHVAPGAGSSIYIKTITADKPISKVKIKVFSDGVGDFTLKRAGVKTEFASDIPLVTGWNEFPVNLDIQAGDLVGYNTATSTASLLFQDGTGGQYVTDNGIAFNGDLAIELYSTEEGVNSFEDLVTAALGRTQSSNESGLSVFNKNNSISKPKLRDLDYGVVSVFNLPETKDLVGDNKITVSSSAITGNFSHNAYAWSFGFTVNMPNQYSTTKNIATFSLGSYTLNIYAGGVGIGCRLNSEENGISYSYGNKKLKFEIIADAYFLNVFVDGQRIGFVNIGKKATQCNFSLVTTDNKTFENIAFWDRDISQERAIQWGLDRNPFVLKGIQDRMSPATGYQISDHLLLGNPYFDIPAEQSIIKFKGKYFLYFTVAKSTPNAFIDGGVGVAVSNRPDGGFMMYTNDAVIGGNRGKAGINRAMASWAGVIGDIVYVFVARDYTAASAGGKIFKSSDGLNFTSVGDFLPTGIPYLANISIFPEKQSNNYYYGIVEGKPGSIWASYLVRSLNFESGWEVVQTLPTLAINPNGMYGGPELLKSANNDRWMLFYHSAYEINGNSPTAIFYAECIETEPKNWVKKGKVLDINDELDFYSAYNVDQVATPQIYEENGKTYMSIVYAQNLPTLHCQIRVFKLDMTKEELVGIIPLDYGFKLPYGDKTSTFTTIIASGTSITNGIGSDGGAGITEANTWRALLQTGLTKNLGRTVTVINAGVNGQNTSGMKSNLPSYIAGNTGQIVILEGAINDAQTAGAGLSTAVSTSNLSDMVDMVRASGNIPVLTTPMPIDISVPSVNANYTLQKRADLVNAVKSVAASKDVELIDLDYLSKNNLGLLVDGLHPDPNAYIFITNALRLRLELI